MSDADCTAGREPRSVAASLSLLQSNLTKIHQFLLMLVVHEYSLCITLTFCSFIGSRPSDHYFRSVCWFVCLFVCLFVQSFSQPSLI